MAVEPNTAAELVRQIFDLQRVVRCVAVSNSRGLEAGVALQGVLRFVGEKESRATHLAARLGVSAPVLSRHIAELEELGLVHRRPDPDDGRAQLVALTDAGRAKLIEIEEHRVATLQEFLQDWSQQDAEETAKVLSKLAESLRESARATTAGSLTATTQRKEQFIG
jgi:DNA-binding MarR family transcriptional regulator